MEISYVEEAIELLEKSNADLEPDLMSAPGARKLLAAYARAEKLAAFGVAALARKLADASEIARDRDLRRQGQGRGCDGSGDGHLGRVEHRHAERLDLA